ncbi:uncharacterized protein LOC118736541 [Rhagoletis pomonella]|uniref:uncharacterized protein LOC118736541 n=1 Tax=Rhagoletis pomonella TaxID=28610 RepID=UPI00177F73C0|nr:uncharacterized protein LOC118736541 [Rhagoletis pomonella]
MDDSFYQKNLENSQNPTLQFVELNKCGLGKNSSKEMYRKRADILMSEFSGAVALETRNRVLNHSLNCWSNVCAVWNACLESEPSAFRYSSCDTCEQRVSHVHSLGVNHKILARKKFGALEEALEYHQRLYKVKCQQDQCPGSCIVDLVVDLHIFIELDIHPELTCKASLRCKLRDFPTNLNFDGVSYRLAGVIERIPGHYVAYTRRTNGQWQEASNIKEKIVPSHGGHEIEPHGVIYAMKT